MITDSYLIEQRDAIRAFTANCRENMHEPDEQGIRGRVRGSRFDNACEPLLHHKYAVEELRFEDHGFGHGHRFDLFLELRNDKGEVLNLNLADLVNLARQAE